MIKISHPTKLILNVLILLFAVSGLGENKQIIKKQQFSFENGKIWKLIKSQGAKGQLSLDSNIHKGGNHSLKVNYEFPSNESYIVIRKNCTIPAVPDKISFELYGDKSNNLYMVRLWDTKGETFQYKLGLLNWQGWHQVFLLPHQTKPAAHWGGNNNSKIELPIKGFALEVRNYGKWGKSKPKGTVFLDNVKITYTTTTSATPPVNKREKRLHAVKNEHISIDGSLSEWQTSKPITIDKQSGHLIEGDITDNTDASARFYSSYDDKNIYFAADVTDDKVVGPFSGHSIWQNDGLELWLDTQLDSSTHGMEGEDDYQIGLCYTTPAGKPGVMVWRNKKNAYIMAAAKVASAKTATGYIIEAAIPLDALELQPQNGNSIMGFDVSLCDNDDGEYAHLFWSSKKDGDPQQFGTLLFGDVSEQVVKQKIAKRQEAYRAFYKGKTSSSKPGKIINKYHGSPAFISIQKKQNNIEQFKKFELDIRLNAEYTNPFDPEQIILQAEIDSPSGKKVVIDGFYYQGYRMRAITATKGEQLNPQHEPYWKIRFTPTEPGQYSYRLTLKDGQGRQAFSEPQTFTCIKSDNNGFLRVSKLDPLYLAFDSGKPFFGVGYGHHLWNPIKPILRKKYHLNQLAAFGMNYTSLNMEVPNGPFSLETNRLGLGNYSMLNAYRLDYILECAERRSIYIIPCINQTKLADLKHWRFNQFNQANGGPCETPTEYFTSPKAQKLIKQRLRYALSRWGYSTAILGFELFNEVNYSEAYLKDPKIIVNWHRDIGQYVKSIDPNKHLLTVSCGSVEKFQNKALFTIPEIDFTITHIYTKDIAIDLYRRQKFMLSIGKPNVGGEIGISWPEADISDIIDSEGTALHNGIWTSAMSKTAGTILNWWEVQYHDNLDLYEHYQAFLAYSKGINWPAESFKPISLQPFATRSLTDRLAYSLPMSISWGSHQSNFTLDGSTIWTSSGKASASQKDTKAEQARLAADGDVRVKAETIPGIIYGSAKNKTRQLSLFLNCPQATSAKITFSACPPEGGQGAVSINGKPLKLFTLLDKDGKANPYSEEMAEVITLPLAKGKNDITIRNTGASWFTINSIVVEKYLDSSELNNMTAYAMTGNNLSLVWFHNIKNTWYLRSVGEQLKEINDVYVNLPVKRDGKFQVEWWDTYKGKVIKTETLNSKAGRLRLTPLPFCKDIACKVKQL